MDRERMEDLVGAYLDRTISPEESEELFAEMRERPDARRYLLLASHTDTALYDLGRAAASSQVARRPWRKIAAAAAILVALAIGGAVYFSDRREPIARLQSTGALLYEGDRFEGAVLGSDGSLLRPGPDTVARLTRVNEVFLEKGTLTAQVTPQPPGRPRIFRTAQAEATVLGTLLKLVETPGSTRLEVEQGRVSLKRLADRRTVDVVTGYFAVAGVGAEMDLRPLLATAPPGFIVAPGGSPAGDGSADAPWDLATALAQPEIVKAGDTIWLRGGVYPGVFKSTLRGTAQAPILVRAFGHERATINGGIEARGSWTTFQGFEIMNSSLERQDRRPPGLGLFGRGHKAVNLIIHDTGNPGIGFRQEVGEGGEVYGCILWGNGTYTASGSTQPVGSAISAQNRDGVRFIRDNIAFRNFQAGLFVYAEQGYADGFQLEGNVVFDHPTWGILATGGENPLRGLKVTDNFTFSRRAETGDLVRFGLLPQAQNADIVVRGNYLILGGSEESFHFFQWRDVSVGGNTVFGGKSLARWTAGAPGNRDWNSNTYFTDGYGTFLTPTARLDYSGWQKTTGFDADSTYNPWAPGGTKVAVRPNAYERGRAHVIVYNWDRRTTVEADLSRVLAPGSPYVVRDAQNYFGPPMARGSYDGKSVTLPLTPSAVAPLEGDCPHLKGLLRPTAPDFAVFVVTPE